MARRVLVPALFAMHFFFSTAHAEMTFYCSFNGAVEPEVHKGAGTPLVEGMPRYTEGVQGQGLVVGEGGAQLQYPVAGNYDLKQSTVSFWVKPLNWKGADDQFHIFFQASASLPGGQGTGARLLYKYMVPGRFLMLGIPDESIPYVNFQCASYADISSWQPGEWHHVVGAWRGSGQTLYLDGRPVSGRVYYPMPMNMGNLFKFGDSTWAKGRNAQTVVDELTLYDRCFNPAEVELLNKRPKAAGLEIALRPFFLRGDVEVYCDTRDIAADTEVRVELLAAGTQGVVQTAQERVRPGSDMTRVQLPISGVKPGNYTIAATVNGGRAQAELVVPPPPVWLNTRVGVSEKVPPPWTDMREEQGKVYCWNRCYEMSPGPFPGQIVSGGAPILARPVNLEVTVGDKPVQWANRGLTVSARKPAEVSFSGGASGDDLRLEVTGRIEFDGMCWFETQLSANPPVTVDRVALEVHLRPDAARFWQGVFVRRIEKHAGEVATEEGVVFEEPFMPVLWVGADDRGIQWFTESSQPWDDPKRAGSVRIIRRADETVLRIEPVASKIALERPWRFAFGLQASPVRPVIPDWRRDRLSGMPGTVHLIWTNKNDMIWFGYPQARNPAELREKVAGFHKRNVRVIPYSTPFLLSIESPESRLYGNEWLRVGEGDSGSSDVVSMGGCAQYAPPGSPHYADFTTWAHQRFVEDIGFDGLYFDGSGLSPFDFEPAGCGYARDGALVPTYPILAKREIMKRMYVMLKELSPEKFLMIHCSGQALLPFMGFADVRAMGEDLGMRLAKNPNYHDILTEAEWRAIQCGFPYGFSNILLPEIKKVEDKPEPTQQAMGLVLLYGMDIWPGYAHHPTMSAMRRACDRFGIVGAEFVPFWREPVKAADPFVRTSVYRRPGRAMLVIVNESTAPVTTTVTFDAKALDIAPGAPWKDLLDDKPMGTGAPIRLEPGNYRLVQAGE